MEDLSKNLPIKKDLSTKWTLIIIIIITIILMGLMVSILYMAGYLNTGSGYTVSTSKAINSLYAVEKSISQKLYNQSLQIRKNLSGFVQDEIEEITGVYKELTGEIYAIGTEITKELNEVWDDITGEVDELIGSAITIIDDDMKSAINQIHEAYSEVISSLEHLANVTELTELGASISQHLQSVFQDASTEINNLLESIAGYFCASITL